MEALVKELLDGRVMLAEAVGEFEKIYIESALERNGGHLLRTAETLGVHRNTLSRRLRPVPRSKNIKKKRTRRAKKRPG